MTIKLIVLSASLAATLALVAGCNDVGEPLKVKVLVLSKKYWISMTEKKLPAEFCKEGEYFRECFKLSNRECLENAEATVKSCLLKLNSQIPKRIVQHEDGVHWGQQVFNCAGHAIELRLKTKARPTAPGCKAAIQKLKSLSRH